MASAGRRVAEPTPTADPHVLMNASHPLSSSLDYSSTLADLIAWKRSTTIFISDCLCL